MTPPAASSPKALPPVRTMAWTSSTMCNGCSRSVSRVAGAPPRTSTPPTAGVSQRITVQPVPASRLVSCPTRIPGMSVMSLCMIGVTSAFCFSCETVLLICFWLYSYYGFHHCAYEVFQEVECWCYAIPQYLIPTLVSLDAPSSQMRPAHHRRSLPPIHRHCQHRKLV